MTEFFATRFLLACLGLVFVLAGLAGWSHPQLFKTYLTAERCLALLGLGVLAILFHYRPLGWMTRLFAGLGSLCFGGLALLGFQHGVAAVRKIGWIEPDPQLLSLWDGRLEFGQSDHRLHLAAALVFLIATLAPGSWEASTPSATETKLPEGKS
jgi:uncharacterized protein YjeT (DUF2065 family)